MAELSLDRLSLNPSSIPSERLGNIPPSSHVHHHYQQERSVNNASGGGGNGAGYRGSGGAHASLTPPVNNIRKQRSQGFTVNTSSPASTSRGYSNFSSPSTSYGYKSTTPRAQLPSEWTSLPQQQQQQPTQSGYAALMDRSPPTSSQLASSSYIQSNAARAPAIDDEVIPTAIVIKNIPFHVAKEKLLAVMEDLRLPPPFAFNYHFDQGQFRGLAFANFRNELDAQLTVTALSGYDLQGRKLRTEFKKVLKEGEKERIERDKALKRMRSQQNIFHSEPTGPPLGTWNRREASAPGVVYSYNSSPGEEEDFGRFISSYGGGGVGGLAGNGGSVGAFGGRSYVPARPVVQDVYAQSYGSESPSSDIGTSVSQRMVRNESSQSGSESGVFKPELDLNDPYALEIYSSVLVFKGDALRDEFAFARSLSATQRRTVHLVAQKLGLVHRSVGEGNNRHVVVYKGASPPPVTLSTSASRPSLRQYHSNSSQSGFEYVSPNDNYLNSPSAHLVSKRSMPNLRHSEEGATTPTRRDFSSVRRPNTNLREASRTRKAAAASLGVQGLFSQFNAPPVPTPPARLHSDSSAPDPSGPPSPSDAPAIPSRPSTPSTPTRVHAPSSASEDANASAVRQPKGPEEDRGFESKTSPSRSAP